MKHIGILAHSAEGSALCYVAACHEGTSRLGAHMHPDITMSITAMGPWMDAWERLDLDSLRGMLAATALRLKAAGADFFACPVNTAHIALEQPGEPLPLPGLHIAEVVSDEAETRGYGRIGVLGTDWTMEGPVYRGALDRRGIDCRVPRPEGRALIHRIIFEELCNGIFRDEARADFVAIIEALATEGCDAVVLGCTEIPLLVSPATSPLPTLDSTRLLATAAVEAAIGVRAFPIWHGGSVCTDSAADF